MVSGVHPWQVMYADDVVLCARDKDSLEDDLEILKETFRKKGKAFEGPNTEYI